MTPVSNDSQITHRFIAERDLISRGISWFGGGDWSHVDVVTPRGTYVGARHDVLKGIAAGYQERPVDYIVPARECFITLAASADKVAAFWKASNAKLGDPYDTLAIWGFVLGRNWAEPGSWECGEAQASNLVCAKMSGPLYLSANRITPNDVTLILTALGGIVFNPARSPANAQAPAA